MGTTDGRTKAGNPMAGSGTALGQQPQPAQPRTTCPPRSRKASMISATRCLPPCPYPSATMARHGGYARLNRLLAATVQIFALGGPAIARRVFGVRPDTPGIDGFIRAARLLRDGQPNTDLRAATDALGRTTQDTGLDQFKPFLRRADEHLTGQSGLLTLVRGELGAAVPRTAAPVLPMPGRLPWGSRGWRRKHCQRSATWLCARMSGT